MRLSISMPTARKILPLAMIVLHSIVVLLVLLLVRNKKEVTEYLTPREIL